jgi:hypothetical protein
MQTYEAVIVVIIIIIIIIIIICLFVSCEFPNIKSSTAIVFCCICCDIIKNYE